MKFVWQIISNPNKFWVCIVKANYDCKDQLFLSLIFHNNNLICIINDSCIICFKIHHWECSFFCSPWWIGILGHALHFRHQLESKQALPFCVLIDLWLYCLMTRHPPYENIGYHCRSLSGVFDPLRSIISKWHDPQCIKYFMW